MVIDFKKTVKIKASSRLAFCLIDMNGQRGRVDGCIGVGLEEPYLEIKAKLNNSLGLRFMNNDFKMHHKPLLELHEKLVNYYPNAKNIDVEIVKTFPQHSGLGFGTQFKMSFASLMNTLNGTNYNNIDLAKQVKRGGTSGIGVWSFSKKGLIIDGGHSFGQGGEKNSFIPSSKSYASPPPLIGNYTFPSNWQIICVTPFVKTRIFGQTEVELFKNNCPVDQLQVNDLSWNILMLLIPSILEENLNGFNTSIGNIQKLGFKKHIWEYQPTEVKKTKCLIQNYGLKGVGLSSLGSTIFITVKKEDSGIIIKDLKKILSINSIIADIWATNVTK